MNHLNHKLIVRNYFFLAFFVFIRFQSFSQILTSSPYSRYGLGELNQQNFALTSAMGGAFAAHHQDSVAPFYINIANPAGLAGLKLTVLEIGGQYQSTKISSSDVSSKKTNTNFSYGALAFPLRKIAGGASFGIMPYSTVGYKISSQTEEPNVGTMNYQYQGVGGINKVFLGTGFKPFHKNLSRFLRSDKYDTLVARNETGKIKLKTFGKELLSELSVGVSGNYLFGNIEQTTHVIYPNSTLYFNSRRDRSVQINDFTINGGLQTHFSINTMKYRGPDTLKKGQRRELKEKIQIGLGFYVNSASALKAKENTVIYNYHLNSFGSEIPKDTVVNIQDNPGIITLPLEIGTGFSIKKGERLTILADAGMTQWDGFKFLNTPSSSFKNSMRFSAGLNYVPNKLARGSSNYFKRIQYRIGALYNDGILDLKNTAITNVAVTAGLGLPVGIGKYDDVGMVNISAQVGRMGSTKNNLLQEDYVRLVLGFTFNKLWFIKYKYD